MSILGNKIKNLREQRGLTQADLAAALNLEFGLKTDRVMISKWETGFQTPIMSTIICLAKYFGVTIDYLNGVNMSNETPKSSAISNTNSINVSAHEKEVLTAYRKNPPMQPAVDKLLGVVPEPRQFLKIARDKDKKGEIEVITDPKEQEILERLYNESKPEDQYQD